MQAASAQDPFDLLFGDEQRMDVSAEQGPGQDDLLLLSLRLDQIRFEGDVPAFRTPGGICVDAAALVEVIDAPVEVGARGMEGWFLTPDRTLTFDLDRDDFTIGKRTIGRKPDDAFAMETGLCLDLDLAGRLFAAELQFVQADLAIDITPDETWPIEVKLAREKMRAKLIDPQKAYLDFEPLENPTRWLSWPTADISLEGIASRSDARPLTGGAVLVGDLAHMTARLQTVTDENDRRSFRSTLSRTDGPVRMALGDVALPPSALIGRPQLGRGFLAGSHDAVGGADILGAQEIRGPLPEGWEAELHDEQGLRAFVTEADGNGDYVFQAVSLRPGYNRLTVKLFGPHGETSERPLRIFLGKELNPENEVRWDLAAVEAGRGVAGTQSGDPQLIARGRVSYGISENATIGIEANVAEHQDALLASTFIFSAAGALTQTRLAWNEEGERAFETGMQGRIGDRHSLALRYLDGGGIENDVLGTGPEHLGRLASFRLEGPIALGGYRLPAALAGSHESRAGGLERSFLAFSASGRIGRATLRKSLRYERAVSSDARSTDAASGSLLLGGKVFGQRLRGQVGYRCEEQCRLGNVTTSLQTRLRSDIVVSGSVGYDREAGSPGFSLLAAKDIGQASLAFNIGHDPQRGWAAGFGLRFSLFRDPGGGIRIGPAGMSDTATLLPRVFEDIDEDGRYGANDLPLADSSFLVSGAVRSAVTDGGGIATIDRLPSGRVAQLEIARASLPDPFLKPSRTGHSVRLRPGQILSVDLPVQQTGEADLVVLLQKGDLKLPIAGLSVEARLGDGTVVGRARTSYDGSAYFSDLPLKPLSFGLAEAELSKFGTAAEPALATLSRSEPYASNLVLTIRSQKNEADAPTGY
jgi:hypothetical protein